MLIISPLVLPATSSPIPFLTFVHVFVFDHLKINSEIIFFCFQHCHSAKGGVKSTSCSKLVCIVQVTVQVVLIKCSDFHHTVIIGICLIKLNHRKFGLCLVDIPSFLNYGLFHILFQNRRQSDVSNIVQVKFLKRFKSMYYDKSRVAAAPLLSS